MENKDHLQLTILAYMHISDKQVILMYVLAVVRPTFGMRSSPIESEENIIDPQSPHGKGSCFYCMLEAAGGR